MQQRVFRVALMENMQAYLRKDVNYALMAAKLVQETHMHNVLLAHVHQHKYSFIIYKDKDV